MLTYVADLVVKYLVYGPWQDPAANNFPLTVAFSDNALFPLFAAYGGDWLEGTRLNLSFLITLVALPVAWMAGVMWFETLRNNREAIRDRLVAGRLALATIVPLAPIAAFLVWKGSILGQNWQLVEDNFFHRTFDVNYSIDMWGKVVDSFVNGVDKTGGIFAQGALPSSSTVYIGLDLLAVVAALAATVWLVRKMPGVALFGLGIIVLSFFSSSAQGMDRYVLAVPAIFLMLASFGRKITFDRTWVLVSTLLMGMLVMLYTFGFWVS